ncbi:MAG: broad specificity phosphatase PhoE [Chlamydiales bacterium]
MKLIFLFIFLTPFLNQAFAEESHDNRRIIVIRHGEGSHNINKVYNSNPSHPQYKPAYLTDKGRAQVRATAEKLLDQGFNNEDIAAVIVSPLPRAKQTAEILQESGLFNTDKVSIDFKLIEVQAGDREGKSHTDFSGDPWNVSKAERYFGENDQQVRERIQILIADLMKTHKEGHIVLVTHGTPALEIIKIFKDEKVRLDTAEAKVLSINDLREIFTPEI